MELNKLTVTITRKLTGAGSADHIQILSSDHISVNVVFMADNIEVKDSRSRQDKIASEKGD